MVAARSRIVKESPGSIRAAATADCTSARRSRGEADKALANAYRWLVTPEQPHSQRAEYAVDRWR